MTGFDTLRRAVEPRAVEGYESTKARFSMHALRHAAAALWIAQGLSPKRVQTLMGHASIQQTFDQYGYLFEAREDEAAMLAGVENGLIEHV